MRKAALTALASLLAIALLAGCAAAEPYDGPTINDPDPLEIGSTYPGGTFNEIALVFIEDIFANDMVSVAQRDVQGYTISSTVNKEAFGDACENYLAEDVIESAPDEWQVETWEYLIDNANFSSVQPYIQFTDSTGNRWVRFWLDSKFAVSYNNTDGKTFGVSDEVIAAVKAQYESLPARLSERRTPERTVELFFEYMNAADEEGVRSLLASAPEELHFTGNSKSKINTLLNLGHIGDFPAEWYENPYSNRVMYVKFDRADADGTRSMTWDFFLVRESAEAEWKIAAYGK